MAADWLEGASSQIPGTPPAFSPSLPGIVSGDGTLEVYAQPDATGTWAARPNNATINIPIWANFLLLTICNAGSGGGSGRRGAAASARSGGAGGGAGVPVQVRIPLRDSAGNLLAPTGTLTIAASPAGGAAQTVDNTDGLAGTQGSSSTFVYNGVTYSSNAGGTAAAGGTSAPVNSGTNTPQMYPVPGAVATSVTGNIPTSYPAGIVAPGSPGGSISAADVLLTVAGQTLSQYGGPTISNTVAGAAGSGVQRGSYYAATGGMGGASSTTAAAGAGGNGIYGSGGGGGGASLNGFASGAGGRGGAGWAVFQWGL